MLTTSKFALPMMILSCLLISDGWAQSASDGFSGRIQRGLDQLKEEPTVREAQGAALRFFNIDPSAVTGMRNRAALKGLMPSLEVLNLFGQNRFDLMPFSSIDAELNPLGQKGVFELNPFQGQETFLTGDL